MLPKMNDSTSLVIALDECLEMPGIYVSFHKGHFLNLTDMIAWTSVQNHCEW